MDLERPVSQDSPARLSPGRSLALAAALVGSFAVLVTANSAGYRFGVSDQAFYVPAVERLITPSLFPRDAALIDSQARLTVSDDLIARIVLSTRAALPAVFFIGYLITVAVFAVAVLAVGRRYYASPWTSAALLFALTFRHRLLETGVNSFEGTSAPEYLPSQSGLPRWPRASMAAARGQWCWSPSRSSCIRRPADGSSSGSPSRSSAPRAIGGPALERRSRSGSRV